jgi:hypothetical protein
MKTAEEFACNETSRSSKLACAGNDGGEHDDVCRLVTRAIEERDLRWRRLVEEARGERENLTAQVRQLMAERDRLKGELAEAKKNIEYLCSLPTPTEARQATCDCHPAAPAEQAQGEAARCDCHKRERMVCDVCQGVTGPAKDIDHIAALAKRLDGLTARLDRIASPPSRPFVSEIKRHWDDPAVRDNFVDATLDDHEARLRGLEWRFKTTDPRAAAPTCRKLIMSLGALCTRRLDHSGDCEHDTRAAAGPGHAFVPMGPGPISREACALCPGLKAAHAVPPIAGEAKP